MITSINGSGITSPVYTPAVQTGASGGAQSGAVRARETEGSYDQVSISQDASSVSTFQREIVSRLVREVRTVNTTGDIQRLREEVRAGSYQPDPAGMAARMLLEGFTIGNR